MPLEVVERVSILGRPDPCRAVGARGGDPVPLGIELDVGDPVVMLHAPDQRAVARVPDRTQAVGLPVGNEAPALTKCDGDDPARALDFLVQECPRPRVPDP